MRTFCRPRSRLRVLRRRLVRCFCPLLLSCSRAVVPLRRAREPVLNAPPPSHTSDGASGPFQVIGRVLQHRVASIDRVGLVGEHGERAGAHLPRLVSQAKRAGACGRRSMRRKRTGAGPLRSSHSRQIRASGCHPHRRIRALSRKLTFLQFFGKRQRTVPGN